MQTQKPMYLPTPEMGVVFQDGRGDRYKVIAVVRDTITYCALGSDRTKHLTRPAWDHGFKHRGWLTI